MDASHPDSSSTSPRKQYVGEVGKPLETARDKAAVGLPLIVFSLLMGFVVGALVCALLSLSNALVDLVWGEAREAAGVVWYPVAVCCLGGLVCGLWSKHIYPPPKSLENVMACVKRTGSYRMESVPKGIVSFLLPLVFGGSVGPEAGLTGIVAALCTKIAGALSKAGVRAKSVAEFTVPATLSAVFGAPILGAVAGIEEAFSDADTAINGTVASRQAAEGNNGKDGDNGSAATPRTFRRGVKVVLYTAVAFGALAGMQVVSLVPGTSCGLPRFEAIASNADAALLALPCLAAGWVLAAVYFAADHVFEVVRDGLGGHSLVLFVVCGLLIGLAALVLPDVLFSGEEQVRALVDAWTAGGISQVGASVSLGSVVDLGAAAMLILTALSKAVATPLCLSFGWKGGHFFPMIFAGASLGFGIAALAGVDAMACVTLVVGVLMGAIMRKPLAAGALLLLCFPAASILWMAIAVLVGSYLPVPFLPSRLRSR